jgi:hypothetical protein
VPISLIVLTVVIVIWALVEVIQADPAHVRRLPKMIWALLVVFPLYPVGAIAWFFLGRPKGEPVGAHQRSSGISLPGRTKYVARPAPDDDPDFLRRLNDDAENRKMFRRLEDDLNGE